MSGLRYQEEHPPARLSDVFGFPETRHLRPETCLCVNVVSSRFPAASHCLTILTEVLRVGC